MSLRQGFVCPHTVLWQLLSMCYVGPVFIIFCLVILQLQFQHQHQQRTLSPPPCTLSFCFSFSRASMFDQPTEELSSSKRREGEECSCSGPKQCLTTNCLPLTNHCTHKHTHTHIAANRSIDIVRGLTCQCLASLSGQLYSLFLPPLSFSIHSRFLTMAPLIRLPLLYRHADM